ncbi:hypothetical protein H8N03_09245 [Ramlibacter sp. USB13]|uniref:Cyclic di-GMP-binding protein n=1 Tax=Ramlibacter cellulosilyticus TaxID=2764187 RepID=A0A923MSQ5_9BURK|nr:hypothetical protein [Ramlibacter cellulosilyticus]MBC5783127.1 hypothetical protein [Ramlibacter cellulosilyticus]
MKLHRVLPAAALAALCLLPGWGTAQQPTQPTLRPATQMTPANVPPQTAVFKPADSAGVWVPRTITFADLGFTEPVVLGYPDTIKEIYLPVPPGVNLNGASLQLDGSYVRADGGRTSLVYTIDNAPVQAFGYTADRGDASVQLPIDGRPRPSGYIKLNIDWRTAVARENTCADARTPGNILRIEPSSRFVFQYDGSAVRDLTTAWGALPPNPVIQIPSNNVSPEVYDTAWRVGVALERAGKRPRIRTADGSGTAPAPVQPVAPGAPPVTASNEPDIIIAGPGSNQQIGSKQIGLANVGNRPVIVVAPDAGPQAAGIFSQIWTQVAAGPTLTVNAVDTPKNTDSNAVSLQYLGAKPTSFDVLAHADWNASFDIGSVAADGKGPGTLVIDVAAAPSAARTPPVVSVFMNDVLLGAKEMEANGKRERIVAPVPRYALQTRNVIRVSFVRQLASDRCRETPEPYPVSVLASSHMLLDKIDPSSDFTGLMSKFSDGGTLLVPQSHLADASGTLPRVIRLAAGTGLSPSKAKFQPVAQGSNPKVSGPYLAVDVIPDGYAEGVKPEQDRLFLAGTKDRPLLDVRGLNRVGILEVTGSGNDIGAVYRTLGQQPPEMNKPIQLSGGNLAVMGNNGLRTEVNTRDPSGQGAMKEAQPGLFERGYWWLMPIILVALFVGLLVFASRMRRRKAMSGDR